MPDIVETVLRQVLEYPYLIIESMASVHSLADLVMEVLVFLGLWEMGWAPYSNAPIKYKLGWFAGGWVLVFGMSMIEPILHADRTIIEFTVSTLTVGALLALVSGLFWRYLENRDLEEDAAMGITILVAALIFFLIVLGFVSMNVKYLLAVGIIFGAVGVAMLIVPK